MKTSFVVGLALLVLLALGGWWILSRVSPTSTSTLDTTPTTSTGSCLPAGELDSSLTIEYTNSKFMVVGSTANGTILPEGESESGRAVFCVPKGGTVTFTGQNLWVASDPHPTHTDLAGFDAKATKDTFSFTFNEAGEWGFHNHLRPDDRGLIIVME